MNFSKLTEYLDTLQDVRVPGCDLVIYKDHKEIYRHQAGFRDKDGTQPMQGDEVYCLYSMSKVFTTCAAMQLIECGKFSLDDPVYWYLPAYKNLMVKKNGNVVPAGRTMTIRHLMSMQSGLDYELDTPAIRRVLAETDGQASTRQLVDAFIEKPLQFEPGTDFMYSLSHDVLAAVMEVAAGQSFGEYLKEHIFEPLGLKTVGFSLKEEDRNRLCAQYEYAGEEMPLKVLPPDVTNYRLSDRYESGGAGLISNVQDYITFVDALACDGTSASGTKILSPEMIQLWSANQLGTASRRTFDAWLRQGYSYGLGVRTRVDLTKGGLGSVGEFGWDGAAGGWGMIDPYRHVSAVYLMHVKNYAYNYDVIHPRLRNLIYEGLE